MTAKQAQQAYWRYNKAKNKAKKAGNQEDADYYEDKANEAYNIWKGI